MTYCKSIILFGINSALILTKNLIANLSTIKKIFKTKIKCYSDEATDFYNNKIPNAGSDHTYLAVITIDSHLDDNYYPQVFLKECKYIEKGKKVIKHITADIEFF